MESARVIELSGIVPVIPTPFRADESIDWDGLAACVEFAVSCGVAAICLPAYAGEFYKLTEAERSETIETAIRASAGRVAVIAQANHPAARCAAQLARKYADLGADLISFALPRQFPVPAADLLVYCRSICRAVPLPVLIQDFNPGGPTVSAEFASSLCDECPNFRYLKLEEPLMASKVRAVRQATGSRVGVLEGWGGMFMLELIPAGICGVMPGLGAADLLQRVWQLGTSGQAERALDIFEPVLPQVVFALQNLELFLCLEKQLLAARGVLPQTSIHVRQPTWTPDPDTLAHGLRLNARLVKACEKELLA